MILPSEPAYESARSVFWKNPSTDRRPAAVARCAGPDDLLRCIELASEHGLPLAVRSGGHSFLGWGTCDDGLVIDLSPMKSIAIDPAARSARIGGGVFTQELVEAAGRHGLVPAQADEFIAALRAVARPLADTVERRPYRSTFGITGAVPRQFSVVKGSFLERLADESLDVVLDRIAGAPGVGPAIGLDHYMHGEVCRVDPAATAFVHRRPGIVHVWVNTGWNNPADAAACTRWVEETWAALQPFSGGQVYANFPGAEGERASQGAYGENYARLARLKLELDPTNLFRQNQNIAPLRA
ncbi:MAG TPA: FAD-binding protein [Terriglobia bacterium]|nr:FAD-binding protein [Terriglobia bacterium]